MSIESIKRSIDKAFESTSIYNSLIVCHDDFMQLELKKVFKEDDYPIVDVSDVNIFDQGGARMLLIDYIDVSNLELILTKQKLNDISAIFLINPRHDLKNKVQSKMRGLNKIEIFELYSEIRSSGKNILSS